MDTIILIVSMWGVLGLGYIICFKPEAKNKFESIRNLICSGPVCWIIVGVGMFFRWIER